MIYEMGERLTNSTCWQRANSAEGGSCEPLAANTHSRWGMGATAQGRWYLSIEYTSRFIWG